MRYTWGDLSTCFKLPSSRGEGMSRQKSAEGIGAVAHGGEGPNVEERKGDWDLDRRKRRRQEGGDAGGLPEGRRRNFRRYG